METEKLAALLIQNNPTALTLAMALEAAENIIAERED
tara:strand:- start:1429 stop:1539 length:111 start_codon:yes stop_codon:yes gene_type:complete